MAQMLPQSILSLKDLYSKELSSWNFALVAEPEQPRNIVFTKVIV